MLKSPRMLQKINDTEGIKYEVKKKKIEIKCLITCYPTQSVLDTKIGFIMDKSLIGRKQE